MKTCYICGNKVNKDWINCLWCGAPLSTSKNNTKQGLICLIIMLVLNIIYILISSIRVGSLEVAGILVCSTLFIGFIFLILAFHFLWKGRFEYGPDYAKKAETGQWLVALAIILPYISIFGVIISPYLITLLGVSYILLGIGFYLMLLFLVPKSSIKILKVGMIFGVIAGIIISSILFMAISDYMAVLNNGSAPSNLSSSYNDAMGIGSLLGSASMVFFLIEAVSRRPINLKMREVAQQIDIFVLILLMMYVIYNDISRILFD